MLSSVIQVNQKERKKFCIYFSYYKKEQCGKCATYGLHINFLTQMKKTS